jgi:hypothetical protein
MEFLDRVGVTWAIALLFISWNWILIGVVSTRFRNQGPELYRILV